MPPNDIGYRPAAPAGRPGPGGAGGGVLPRHRHGRRVPASQGGVARAGLDDDHHPDTTADRPARRGDRPARLLPRARRPRPQLRHRQVRLRDRQAALRRRHLRQLLQEGDRLARRRPRARTGPGGHADDGRGERGGDHHAGRHPVRRRLRPRVVIRGDRRPAARAVRLPGTAGLRRKSWPSGPARSRSSAAASPSASRTSTSPRSAGSATSGSGQATRWWPRSWGCPPASAGRCSSRSCCSTPASPGARTRSWPSSARTSGRPARNSTSCATSPASPPSGCATATWTRSGPAMRESWEAKRKLAPGVSNEEVDAAVTRALDAGAAGAKLTGAGGGGFLLVICPMERQRAVRESLARHAGTAGEAGPPRLARGAQRAARHLVLRRYEIRDGARG